MSGINQIRIYYGQGEVVNGPSGADLGLFPHITIDHPHPESASIRDLKDWFMAMFQLDANLCSVTVILQALIQLYMSFELQIEHISGENG